MLLSDDSSEISPSLAELTTQVVPAATTVSKTQSTPTAPTAVAVSEETDRPAFPVTMLGPTNSSNQAPPNRHNDDDDDVHTTYAVLRISKRADQLTSWQKGQRRKGSDSKSLKSVSVLVRKRSFYLK